VYELNITIYEQDGVFVYAIVGEIDEQTAEPIAWGEADTREQAVEIVAQETRHFFSQ